MAQPASIGTHDRARSLLTHVHMEESVTIPDTIDAREAIA